MAWQLLPESPQLPEGKTHMNILALDDGLCYTEVCNHLQSYGHAETESHMAHYC